MRLLTRGALCAAIATAQVGVHLDVAHYLLKEAVKRDRGTGRTGQAGNPGHRANGESRPIHSTWYAASTTTVTRRSAALHSRRGRLQYVTNCGDRGMWTAVGGRAEIETRIAIENENKGETPISCAESRSSAGMASLSFTGFPLEWPAGRFAEHGTEQKLRPVLNAERGRDLPRSLATPPFPPIGLARVCTECLPRYCLTISTWPGFTS